MTIFTLRNRSAKVLKMEICYPIIIPDSPNLWRHKIPQSVLWIKIRAGTRRFISQLEELLDEGPEFVVRGYHREPIINATACHINYFSSVDEQKILIHSEPVNEEFYLYLISELPLFEESKCNAHVHTIKYFQALYNYILIINDWKFF